jgi:predicted TPR repeat methyltransferase
MDSFDFKGFYESQHDYAGFRNDPEKREEYSVAVNWKVRNLCSLVPPGITFENVTEVGCAMGILLNKVADTLRIENRTGVDIASENIRLATELFPASLFFNGTLEDYIAKYGSDENRKIADLVILSDIVEHIPDDKEFMRKVSGMSKYVLFNLPLEKCYRNRNRKYGTDDPSGHLRNYDKDDADYLAGSSGFDIIKSFTVNAHTDSDHFRLFRAKRKQRIKAKPLLKRIFWSGYYFAEDMLLSVSPVIYSEIYGSNYFALLRSVR